jgi:two-component system OmpR family response regulator
VRTAAWAGLARTYPQEGGKTAVARILIADDDSHIREVVRFALERAGHQVIEASNGATALARAATDAPDLIVLDVLMPEQDGLDVCRRVRAASDVPILFLSSRDEELDRVLGLEIGGDDYVTKPFSPRELVARVKAMLRRAPAAASPDEGARVRRGDLVLDVERHRCTWAGDEIPLTATEFMLLRSLMTVEDRVYSRDELVERAYGHGHHITARTVDSHVRRIRRKFAACGVDPIETVYGVGYRLRASGDVG